MKKVLVYFTGFSEHVGGSETLVFSLIHALQRFRYSVTLALSEGGDVRRAAECYDSRIDLASLKIIRLCGTSGLLKILDGRLRFLWMHRLRHIGRHYDFCISCANPVDFGRPGIHFVHMMTLDAGYFNKVWYSDLGHRVPVKKRFSQIRDEIVRVLAGTRSARKILSDTREIILPNSDYVRRSIDRHYGCCVHTAFYPPTLFAPNPIQNFQSLDVACIGRVGPEKHVIEIVQIVERARYISGLNLRLRIAGYVSPDNSRDSYGTRVRFMAKSRPWVTLEGILTGISKAAYLSACRFAVHACHVEAFGISVTEYLKSGVVPVVPAKGGCREIVGDERLIFESVEGAAHILARLASDHSFYDDVQRHCLARASFFSATSYLKREEDLLTELGVIPPSNQRRTE